jgi:hypothetical protein
MIKFDVNAARFGESCSILDQLNVLSGHQATFVKIAPRFAVDDKGKYLVKVNLDEDGDLDSLEFEEETFTKVASKLTPKRLETLKKQMVEAAKAIVNPPNERG